MGKRIALILCWIPAVAWMGVIFYFSMLPESATPGRDILPDKVCHAGEYFILAFLILFALQRTTQVRFSTSFWITLAWGAVYGLSDEIHQLYVPTRQFDVMDIAADIGGIVVLFLMLWVLQRLGERGSGIYRLFTGKQRD